MNSAHDIAGPSERFGIRMGLDHLRGLARTGLARTRDTAVIVAARTSGRGSVASLLAAIAALAFATGLFLAISSAEADRVSGIKSPELAGSCGEVSPPPVSATPVRPVRNA